MDNPFQGGGMPPPDQMGGMMSDKDKMFLQQALAQQMMQQGAQAPQGQMAGRVFVPPAGRGMGNIPQGIMGALMRQKMMQQGGGMMPQQPPAPVTEMGAPYSGSGMVP
jgi:hypothetical protein